jgi:hypothetical protein
MVIANLLQRRHDGRIVGAAQWPGHLAAVIDPGAGGEQQRDLLEIVEDRYGAGSRIITSQVPVDHWYEIVGNPTLADTILDRIIHYAHRIELRGETMRKPPAGG